MSLDPSQLTLPQIAAAVAAGQLRLADAEGEIKRRPATDLPLWRRRPPAVLDEPPQSAAEVFRALERTRRELRKATRTLEHLAERFESLVQAAARIAPASSSESTVPRPARVVRRRRIAATPTAQ